MPPPFVKPAPSLSKMATYLVTGSSRGLGFNIVNHLASRPASEVGTIFATSRQTISTQLQELIEREKGRVAFVKLDAASQASVRDALGEVERQWLRTDLGGADFADLPPATGAEATMQIIDSATREMNGKFLNIRVPGWEENPGVNQYDGKEVPW
ncbi:uncharacterized protein LDX57_000218 [Aspergillus melleus]|uniref:uncharacterized protein n=1 Tax=Aspergillus melleus TaxID=138277 RepID=UPI001E8EF24F|nr:uncharacterized protein LDX57_000218 [Aspergillus melleus]KAH8422463.1 hypothetical protein LDX57_000218 [Aspergillus melleus]